MATSAPVNALTPEEQAVLVPIQDFFDGIAKAVDFGQFEFEARDEAQTSFFDRSALALPELQRE
jgi:hypothetical protein